MIFAGPGVVIQLPFYDKLWAEYDSLCLRSLLLSESALVLRLRVSVMRNPDKATY